MTNSGYIVIPEEEVRLSLPTRDFLIKILIARYPEYKYELWQYTYDELYSLYCTEF
jgi:hypothetical protein